MHKALPCANKLPVKVSNVASKNTSSICKSAPQLEGMVPYDPKYMPADAFMSANENPFGVPERIRQEIDKAISGVSLNRYPNPLANALRKEIAKGLGVETNQVLVGNGGDELLFDIALAWGGPDRKFLNLPPTFSVYETNARLTNTEVVRVPRRGDYSVAEEELLMRASKGDISYIILTNPNNPTGNLTSASFIRALLEATNALVLVDEAYCEFAKASVVQLLKHFENLCILRTFSKAYGLAACRVGYLLGSAYVISELLKVRQPYSVNALSQAAAHVVYKNRKAFEPLTDAIIAQRERMFAALAKIPNIKVFPTRANFMLVNVPHAHNVWEKLYERGILVRDFSGSPALENCLRLTVGTPEQNDALISALEQLVC